MKDSNFSVIIPCFNTGKTLQATVNSVLAQTLDNVQIIIVDDASTDTETHNKIEAYCEYADIIALEQNRGLSHARNIGIAQAKSQYILCLDSDDYIGSTYLSQAKKIFDDDALVGTVGAGVQNFGESTTSWIHPDKFTIPELLASNRLIVASCFRKTLFDQVGGFDTDLKAYEDWEFWIRVFSSEKNWENKVIQENLFYYNVRSNSMQHSMSDKAMADALDVIYNKHRDLYAKHVVDVLKELHIKYTTNRLSNKKLIQELRELKMVNTDLTTSKIFRISSLWSRTIKSPYKIMSLPYNFIKIVLE